MAEIIKQAKALVDFALEYDVDYVYILEDLQKVLSGRMIITEDLKEKYLK